MFQVIANRTAGHKGKHTKVTCLTCKLKGCVGKCRFEAVECPRPTKAA